VREPAEIPAGALGGCCAAPDRLLRRRNKRSRLCDFFPAALLTLLLRGVGMRGCKSPQSAALIAEAERNTGSPWPTP
jgi:hypothetical protein